MTRMGFSLGVWNILLHSPVQQDILFGSIRAGVPEMASGESVRAGVPEMASGESVRAGVPEMASGESVRAGVIEIILKEPIWGGRMTAGAPTVSGRIEP